MENSYNVQCQWVLISREFLFLQFLQKPFRKIKPTLHEDKDDDGLEGKKIHVLAEVKESNFVLNLEMHLFFFMPCHCCYLTAATKCLSACEMTGVEEEEDQDL